MTRFISVLGAGALVTLAGCASIVSDSSYPVAIKSTPDGAAFEVVKADGQVVHSGTTPQTVSLTSGDSYFSSAKYVVKFKKEGFEDQTITLDSSLDGWYWGNILIGGLIGMLIVDPITGAMWKLPEGTDVALAEATPPTAPVAEGEVPQVEEATEAAEGVVTPVEEADANAAEPTVKAEDTVSLITIDQIPADLRSQLVRIN